MKEERGVCREEDLKGVAEEGKGFIENIHTKVMNLGSA